MSVYVLLFYIRHFLVVKSSWPFLYEIVMRMRFVRSFVCSIVNRNVIATSEWLSIFWEWENVFLCTRFVCNTFSLSWYYSNHSCAIESFPILGGFIRSTDWGPGIHSFISDWISGLELREWNYLFVPSVFVGLLCSKACTLLVHSNCMEWVLPYYAVAYQILFHSLCLVQSDPEYVILPWMYDLSYIPIIWLVKIVANLLSHIVIFVLW